MTTISKDNRIVVQEKFTELEISTAILALQYFIKELNHNEKVEEAAQKVINKLNKVYK